MAVTATGEAVTVKEDYAALKTTIYNEFWRECANRAWSWPLRRLPTDR